MVERKVEVKIRKGVSAW